MGAYFTFLGAQIGSGLALLLLLIGAFLSGDIQENQTLPRVNTFTYTLVDLGEAQLPLEKLSRQALPNTFAPIMNNLGQIVVNRGDRGYILDKEGREISPQISTMTSFCHGINDAGELLLAFQRSPKRDVFWSLWTQKNLQKTQEQNIDQGELLGRNIFLRTLGNGGMAAGTFIPEGKLRPIVWTKCKGLHHLGYYLGWDISGIVWRVNDKNCLVGSMEEDGKTIPFSWSLCHGLYRLNHFEWKWRVATRCPVHGPIYFVDFLIAHDGLVYGTFTEGTPTPVSDYHAYWWDPKIDEIRPLNLQGMRLSSIDEQHTLVGSLNDHAAICQRGSCPILLKELADVGDWRLLDATDINRCGDIVGYGIHHDKIHYFLLKRKK